MPVLRTDSPTSMRPTVTPTFQATPIPSMNPTIIPTQLPSTLSPSQVSIGLNSGSVSSQTSGPTTTIASIVVGVVVFLIIIGLIVFCIHKKNRMSPYEIWSTHYSDNKKNKTVLNPSVNEDIHHFYSKGQRPSMSPNPVFTPHLSANPSYRNSQLGGKLGSQRNSIRLSLPNKRLPQQNYAL